MGYSTAKPPIKITKSVADGGTSIWVLTGTDTAATVNTAGYISNAGDLGMKVADTVLYTQTGVTPLVQTLLTVQAITAGAADLTDGQGISGSNTD